MFGPAKVLLIITPFVLAIPGAAQAPTPTTTTFDGIYGGVWRRSEGTIGGAASRTMQGMAFGGASRFCAPDGVPSPLTIVNGVARTAYGGGAEGSVSPQGVLVMQSQGGARFEGRIDGKGTIAGRFTGGCSTSIVWQKKDE